LRAETNCGETSSLDAGPSTGTSAIVSIELRLCDETIMAK
jgi:hypothetical protein